MMHSSRCSQVRPSSATRPPTRRATNSPPARRISMRSVASTSRSSFPRQRTPVRHSSIWRSSSPQRRPTCGTGSATSSRSRTSALPSTRSPLAPSRRRRTTSSSRPRSPSTPSTSPGARSAMQWSTGSSRPARRRTTRPTGTSSRSVSGPPGGIAATRSSRTRRSSSRASTVGPNSVDPRFQEYVGRTDASGTHLLQIDFDDIPASSDPDGEAEPIDQPTAVTAEATVFDVNRQAISSRTDLIVHPARFYVGLRSDRGFVEQGEPIVIDTTIVDVDGTPIAGREFTVTAGRLDYTFEDGRYVEELVDEQTCTVTSTDVVTNEVVDESMRCEFSTEVGGQYEITAIVADDDGRTNRAVYTQWVSGSTARPTRDLTQGEVVIVPDAEFHAPGDTAEILVQAPFSPASGLVTVTRVGIESVEAFDAPDGSAVITVPIADDDIPSLDVRIDMVGADERVADDGTPLPDAPPQPAFAAGQITLQIPPVDPDPRGGCVAGRRTGPARRHDLGVGGGERTRRRTRCRRRGGTDRRRRSGALAERLPTGRPARHLLPTDLLPARSAIAARHDHPRQSRRLRPGRRRRGCRRHRDHGGSGRRVGWRPGDRRRRCGGGRACGRPGIGRSRDADRRASRLRCARRVRPRRAHRRRRHRHRRRRRARQPHPLSRDGGRRRRRRPLRVGRIDDHGPSPDQCPPLGAPVPQLR